MRHADVLIIGGGFYGCLLALFFKDRANKIIIAEKEEDLMTRASYRNQARVHVGFHYPRSYLTAYRSLVNLPKFVKEFHYSIVDSFSHLYAISKNDTKINSYQFWKIFKNMNAPIKRAPKKYGNLFDSRYIEESFLVDEPIFDAKKIKKRLQSKLFKAGIQIFYKSEITKVSRKGDKLLSCVKDGETIQSPMVINCTYASINSLLYNCNLPLLDFKQELAEMAIVDVPNELKKIGVTVMDGPFFSLLPFPPLKKHTLTHVRFTPHMSWLFNTSGLVRQYRNVNPKLLETSFPLMKNDAQRFMPAISNITYRSSIYEIKNIMIKNENDDGRPILFKKNYHLPGFHVIMGGKIDNIFDIIQTLEKNSLL